RPEKVARRAGADRSTQALLHLGFRHDSHLSRRTFRPARAGAYDGGILVRAAIKHGAAPAAKGNVGRFPGALRSGEIRPLRTGAIRTGGASPLRRAPGERDRTASPPRPGRSRSGPE